MKKKIVFVTGGTRSGKSRFALELAGNFPGPRAYLATAQPLDQEMAERIERHRRSRPGDWHTLEEPLQVAQVVQKEGDRFGLILFDCLTLWISNLMLAEQGEEKILEEADRFLAACREARCSLIIVGNEVGMGIVPDNALSRNFRDLAGLIQQRVAAEADEAYFLICGLPQKIKGAP